MAPTKCSICQKWGTRCKLNSGEKYNLPITDSFKQNYNTNKFWKHCPVLSTYLKDIYIYTSIKYVCFSFTYKQSKLCYASFVSFSETKQNCFFDKFFGITKFWAWRQILQYKNGYFFCIGGTQIKYCINFYSSSFGGVSNDACT